MMQLSRGMRDKLSKYIDCNNMITINMSISGNAVYDYCCFGVDAQGKLSNESYMIFYNQTSSPRNEICFQSNNNSAIFNVNLNQLPASIDKLVFTVSIDGNGTMGDILNHTFSLSQNNAELLAMSLAGSDFNQEKAIISVEIYRKDEWRINAVANGFNGGLSALLAAYGGTEAQDNSSSAPPIQQSSAAPVQQPVIPPAPAPVQQTNPVSGQVKGVSLKKTEEQLTQEVMGKISLSKDKVNLEKHVVSLSKCVVDLSKKSGVDMGSMRAKVVVVLDYSGSMSSLYNNGTVQKTLQRLVPLGLTFDNNGSIDVYLFQNDYRKMDDLNLKNYENYVSNIVKRSGYSMGGTNYAPVLKAIILGDTQTRGGFLGFGGHTEVTHALVDDGDPTFILFITDGENADRNATDDIIRKSSEMNVFIQFIGIGNERFTYLKKLDDMKGRKRDNTGFSKMKDLAKADDNELYTNVLEQFSQWLKHMQ